MTILPSGRVTASTVAKQSFANIWNLLKDNITIPKGLPLNHKMLYRRMPRIGRTFDGFPFVILSRTGPTKGKNTADLSKVFRDYNFSITVFSKDSSSDINKDPNGADQCDDLTSDIINILDKPSNRKDLIDKGMRNLEYNVEPDEDEFEGKSVFLSEFDVRFPNNLIVTS